MEHLDSYEADTIKFVTKIEVDESRAEGLHSSIRIFKEPIFAEGDRIVFLLSFQWYPNSIKNVAKLRKGSFATEKEVISVKVRFNRFKAEEEDLLSIVYLLSEKIYIEEGRIDEFTKVIAGKHEVSSQHQNCLTAILFDSVHKRNVTTMASTTDESKFHYYYYDNSPSYGYGDKPEVSFSMLGKNESQFSRLPPITRRNSININYDKSPRCSLGSRELISEELPSKLTQQQFNVEAIKKHFSAI